MNDWFANRFEDFLIYDQQFSDYVHKAHDYQMLGIFLIIIPILVFFVFYKPIDPQPVKLWKWFVTFLISAVLLFLTAYYWLYSNSMYNPIQNEQMSDMSAVSFTLQLSFWAVVFSIIPALLFSWIWSRTVSINNAKNPF